jgi:hypothetical protein
MGLSLKNLAQCGKNKFRQQTPQFRLDADTMPAYKKIALLLRVCLDYSNVRNLGNA